MPSSIADSEGRLENSSVTAEKALFSLRTDDLSFRLEEMRLEDCMKDTQHQREQEAKETEIRRLKEENERMRMQFEENRKAREHAEKMKRLEMEEKNKAREHELKPEALETLRMKLELAKETKETEKLRQVNLKFKNEDGRHAREHKERMATFEVDILNSAEEIRRQRRDERRIVKEENQEQISELNNRCEQLERQRRKEEEQDIRCLRNLGLVATGVGAASGAIGGALGTTAAVGLAAELAGAATVLAPISGTVAIMSRAGYVYKKVTSSNRA